MAHIHGCARIILPEPLWKEIKEHCRRKLAGDFLPDESPVPRAYGILAGSRHGDELVIDRVLPVKKNARNREPLKSYMDQMLTRHAVPSTTPTANRGWITDPAELMECYNRCDREDLLIFGTYHMHVVAWKGDPRRDTPTRLDTLLAEKSNLFTFIISMVDISSPSIRAFFEGDPARETPLVITDRPRYPAPHHHP